MYNILVVDDEQIERNGIKFLIKKYGLELNVVEAENGKKALEHIENNSVDILFTDIKMPFMDGLELSYHAKKLNPKLKIIIYSAFEEFEYAKKAIDISVVNYLIKPIKVKEFVEVISNVIELLKQEQIQKLKNEEIVKKSLQYEKEKILLELVNGIEINDQFRNRMNYVQLDFSDKNVLMLMIDFKSRFYDIHNDDFKKMLIEVICYDYEYLNLNERQGLLFIYKQGLPYTRNRVEKLGESIKELVDTKYGVPVYIIISKNIKSLDEFGSEFDEIERTLDYKFFHEKSLVLFTNEGLINRSLLPESVEEMVESINKYIDLNDQYNTITSIEMLLANFQSKANYSAIYVKYKCTEIIKKILLKFDKKSANKQKDYIEKVLTCSTLSDLKEIFGEILAMVKINNQQANDESDKKVIKDVIKIILENYMTDISVEWLAEKVYLSPNYLSYLFKKEKGQSLSKYITGVRLDKGKELLENTNMKIVDICEKVGYTNTSYFGMTFKNYYGISPQKFRDQEE